MELTDRSQLYSPSASQIGLRQLNLLAQAKLPAAAKGEYNFALCVSTEFSYEVISLLPLGNNLAKNTIKESK